MGEPENHALPAATNDSWRTWLVTGVRRAPVDRRRLRGAHRGLKKMLLEGMTNGGDKPQSWRSFSGAMVRHAVDEAMRALPSQDKALVKLAYFGGLSNREIASSVGMNEATVQRRLSRAVHAISEHIERGRSMGRRAFCALILWLSGRRVGDATHHVLQAAAVMSVAAVIVAQPAAPTRPDAPGGASAPKHEIAARAAAIHHDEIRPTQAAADEGSPLRDNSLPTIQVPDPIPTIRVPDPVRIAVPPLPVKLPPQVPAKVGESAGADAFLGI